MSKPTASKPGSHRRKPVRLGFSGVAAIASIGIIAICFGELTGGKALGRDGNASPVVAVANGRNAPLPLPTRALLGKRQSLNGRLDDPALRGKIVLVNFWTYSCINSLRPLPYLKIWAEKYRSRGLVVVGVHTPEFRFEKDPNNVRGALAALNVTYPVVLDSDFGIWRAFGNGGWPGFYLLDADGRVRHHRLGEGDVAETERWIEHLLAERDGKPALGRSTPIHGRGVEAAADWANQHSPETYLGYAKASGFSSPGGLRPDSASYYTPAVRLPHNRWDFSGPWTAGSEFAVSSARGSRVRYNFHARDLHLVMGPAPGGAPIRFRITINGAAPGADHGVDVDPQGWGEIRDNRLYQLVRQAGAIRDRTFEINFATPGARVYVFTFG